MKISHKTLILLCLMNFYKIQFLIAKENHLIFCTAPKSEISLYYGRILTLMMPLLEEHQTDVIYFKVKIKQNLLFINFDLLQ